MIRKKCAICDSIQLISIQYGVLPAEPILDGIYSHSDVRESEHTGCGLNSIYEIPNVPIKLCCTEIPQYDTSTMSFVQCSVCNTIQLEHLIPLNILYSDSHNQISVGKTWSNYFDLFVKKITPLIKDKTILEIGCPSGKIALRSTDYKKWYIAEPNKNPKIEFPDTIEFLETYFDESFEPSEPIDIIIHSHVFEHIYEPNQFLKKCHQLLRNDGEMFFGVPNMEYLAKTNIAPFLGIFFEHTIFLNKDNITNILHRNGFEIMEITDYENHSILYHCKKSVIKDIPIIQIPDYKYAFLQSVQYYTDFIIKCNSVIEKTNKSVYIFGASYNTQIILSLESSITMQNYNKIKGILDNNKEKQGKFLYGYSLQVFSPNIIDNNSIVIVKNGYYANEIIEQLQQIVSDIEIII